MLSSPVLSNSAAPHFVPDLHLHEGCLLASIVKMASGRAFSAINILQQHYFLNSKNESKIPDLEIIHTRRVLKPKDSQISCQAITIPSSSGGMYQCCWEQQQVPILCEAL